MTFLPAAFSFAQGRCGGEDPPDDPESLSVMGNSAPAPCWLQDASHKFAAGKQGMGA